MSTNPRRVLVQAETTGLRRARTLYDEELGRLGRELRAAPDHQVAGTLTRSIIRLAQRLTTNLAGAAAETLTVAAEAVSRFAARLLGREVEPAQLVRAIRLQRGLLLDSQMRQGGTLGAHIAGAIKLELAAAVRHEVNLSRPALVAKVQELTEAQWWRVERVVRTETAATVNRAHEAVISELQSTHPRLRKRWTERVNDFTGQPMDKAVGKDSIAMHGQAVLPGASFTMPPEAPVGKMLQGRSWLYPPNRPNDRAIILPWMDNSGIPAWELRGGVRVPL